MGDNKLGKSSAAWGKKKEWGAKLFKNESMDCEAGSDNSESSGVSKFSKNYGGKYPSGFSSSNKFYPKPAYSKRDGSFASNSTGVETELDSEEEDKNALYDIIHNMVDRILETRNEKVSWEENSKKTKID